MTADYIDNKPNYFYPDPREMRINPVNDLATLEVLDEANVLHTLGNRFNQNKYYTYIGDILVAINPCQPVNLYDDKKHEQYKELYNRSQEEPHIYWVADELYRNLRDSGDDQCGIVSGESGAGKTESIKHILKQLIRLCPNNVKDLVEQLDQVNPLLELFGNATTPLNKNSSRFCKFIELQYTAEGQLRNGQIQCFILEKSRLIQRRQNEKNFHIFYALLGGLSPYYKQQFTLGDVADYRILANEDETDGVFVNQADFKLFMDKFEALEIALQKIGFQSEEISNIYSVLSAILNLTNISFDQDDNTDELQFEDEYLVQTVAELLNIEDIDGLKNSLLRTSLSLGNIYKHKSLAEANEGRDALAKELYQRLFSCIIDKINSKLKESVPDNNNLQTKKLPTINLLDISGFENLKVNGFEQLLINTANEVLHQIFLNHVMKREQEEYEKEGVKWKEIEFRDNEEVINLITKKKPSIFSLLEEAASVPTGSDETLIFQLNKHFTDNPLYECENIASKEFGIFHYADKVSYNVAGFTEKTKDTLSRCLKNIIQQSGNPLVKINATAKTMDGKRESMRLQDIRMKRCEAVTEQFKASLRQLQTKLNQSNLMFVRCLKPNPYLKPMKFDTRCMNIQLKACGLAEAAKIRRLGFPVRLCHSTFVERYEIVIPTEYTGLSDIDKCKCIIRTCRIDHFHIGKTKILLDYAGKSSLELEKRNTILQSFHEKDLPENIKRTNFQHQRADAQSLRSSFSTNCHIPGKLSRRNSQKNFMETEQAETQNASTAFQMDQSKIPAYDAFRESERSVDEDSDFFTKMLKFLRFLFYIFLICGILISAVSNRIGLLLLAGSPDKKEEHAKLFLSLGIPMLFSWGWNAMSCAFRGKVKTSWRSYICIGSLEISRTIANGVLVFLLLPALGLIRGLIMMYGIGQVPALLLFLETFSSKVEASRIKRRLGYFFVFILQLGIVPAYLATNFLIWTDKNGSVEIDRLKHYRWLIPIVIIVISLSLWENYALFDIKIGRMHIPLSQWRKRMMKVREATNFYIEPLKIIIFWLISKEIADYDLPACWETYKTTIHDPVKHLRNFGIMYLEIISAMICTYLSGMACKLHMQKFGFATPLVLVMPVSIVLSYFICDKGWIPKGTFTTEFQCCKIDILNELLSPIVIVVVALITTLAITFHIWEPKSERMALLSKLFVPQFDPLLLDVSLLLRRRQDLKEDKVKHDGDERPKKQSKPKLFVCATTWHETRQEMVQILKSLFRLDFQNKIMELTNKYEPTKPENDIYELEIHIIFDDAWETDDNGQAVPNSFVKEFVTLIPEAAMSVAKGFIKIQPITKVTTPYGGRLEMKMPGGTEMIIHLKNKEKIRHRKRWSQVMYLYYLLGFKFFGEKGSVADVLPKKKETSSKVRRNVSILNHLSEEEYAKIENTFLLTLDGDVDFKPDSVRLLLDRMIMNKKVGAVCGRIHPIGSGPMIWYQQFEYAVGHWLQKAAEHVFGCVLCCPGCFSLFRASAVMDDNVMRAYTRKPIVARDYIQYEQGEDRWLCTLLLQQGYRIDYCAGADAYTFAPESFHDFYIQRRRWAPSTIANIMDLLSTWHTTVYLNDNISIFFMFYQFILMTSSILAPATVVLMIAGSYNAVLKISMWKSFILSLFPVLAYIAVCFKYKTATQINIAAFMTSIYSVVMVIVTVGTIISILQDDLVAPNVVFLAGLSVVFSVCGILHPREIICLIHGILYFLTVPSSFIFLTIYFLCNLNIVSWGTREVAKKLTPEEEEEAKIVEEQKKKKKKEKSFFNFIGLLPLIEEIKKTVYDLLGKPLSTTEPNGQETGADVENQKANMCSRIIRKPIIRPAVKAPVILNEHHWTSLSYFGNGKTNCIEEKEKEFWHYIIQKYLHPLQENKDEKEKIKKDLEETRNNVVFGYFLLNLLWSVAIMQLQTRKDEMLPFFIAGKYEPISVMFLGIFGIVLILQFIGMCIHRWGTFLHLMSTTHLRSNDEDRKQRLEKKIKELASASAIIDIKNNIYCSDTDSENDELDEMSLPEADYDTDGEEYTQCSSYERFYIDRIKTLKSRKRATRTNIISV